MRQPSSRRQQIALIWTTAQPTPLGRVPAAIDGSGALPIVALHLFIFIARSHLSPSLASTQNAARQAARRGRPRSDLASTDTNPHAPRTPSEQGCSRQRGGSIRCRRGDTRANPTPGVDRGADYRSGLTRDFGGRRRSRCRSRREWGSPSRCRSSSRSAHTAPTGLACPPRWRPGTATHRKDQAYDGSHEH